MKQDFSFADHAETFDKHIAHSIPGYKQLLEKCVSVSPRFVQDRTSVIDIGCSTGSLLTAIRKANDGSGRSATYVGIDVERNFRSHWRDRRARNARFEICDAREFEVTNASLVCSLFTLQFIPPPDKVPLLQRIHDGLVEGGALIIAEKTLASSPRLQDALTFPYYDYKRQTFTAEAILDKERALRGPMKLWTEAELRQALLRVGFREVEPIWANFPFVAALALKSETLSN